MTRRLNVLTMLLVGLQVWSYFNPVLSSTPRMTEGNPRRGEPESLGLPPEDTEGTVSD